MPRPSNRTFRRWEAKMHGIDRENPATWPRRVIGLDGKVYAVFPRPISARSAARRSLVGARSMIRAARRKAEERGIYESDLALICEIIAEADIMRQTWLEWVAAAAEGGGNE